jgi:hypothetical protein
MATYKVPQDVEAEDKIIGFLSLKQFIFVLVMVASLWMCWILARANIGLGLIPLPIAIISGVLGLYQRKDQPVEVFLASWLRYLLKPRVRKWDQEGIEERVIITVPKHIEKNYTKGLTEQQVNSRLAQLSSLLDSRGWAAKQTNTPVTDQRLFSMQELSRYAHPQIPLDQEAESLIDTYDTADPRNRTAQEVSKDINKVTKQQHDNALAVIEKARSQPPKLEPRQNPTTSQTVSLTPPMSPTESANEAVPPHTMSQPNLKAQPPKKVELNSQTLANKSSSTNNEEVVIELHHKK